MLDHAGHWARIRDRYRGVITSADGITPRLRRRQSPAASPLPGPTTRRKPELAVSAQHPATTGQSPVTVSGSRTIAPRRGPLGITGFRNFTLRASGKFRASVMVNRKRIVLGEWDTAAAAAAAAKEFKHPGNSSYRRAEAALSDIYDLVSEKRMSKVLVYGDEKRKIKGFVAVLRSHNRPLYASSAEML